jgi:surfeit locus 1 family protein
VPSGQIGSVDLSLLVNRWPGELYNAFGFLESEDPPTASGLETVPTPVGDRGVQWRNAAYAVQWWIFAAFTLWMWARMVRDETRRARAEAAPVAEGSLDGAEEPGDKEPVAAGDNGSRDDA